MDDETSRYTALLHGVFDGLPRQAPGRTVDTLAALRAVPDLPAAPRIADLGCGEGASALPLARAGASLVVACDRHLPALTALRRAAGSAGLAERIRPLCADMARPPLAAATFDVVWSEGAIYAIGFAHGLAVWRPLLRPGGALVVSELVWLTERRPAAARAFWSQDYPGMTDAAVCRTALSAAGYRLVTDFVLPPAAWEDYYAGLAPRLPGLERDHPGDPVARRLAADLAAEIDIHRRFGRAFGYVMFVAQAAGP